MKSTQKESEALAKEEAQEIKEKLLSKHTWTDEDFLPENQQAKQFDPERPHQANVQDQSSEISTFLDKSRKRESFEGTEDFLRQSQLVISRPEQQVEIAASHTELIPEEVSLQTCEERGVYQVAFSQKLSVDREPEVKKTVKLCHGHDKSREYYWKGDAKHEKHSKEKQFSKDPDIDFFDISIKGGGIMENYVVEMKWHHKEDASSCKKYWLEERVVKTAREEDSWTTEDVEGLAFVEADPTCKLLWTQNSQVPETRIVNGGSVFRPSWERVLHFSCEPDALSKCAQLREQGGVLVSKKCLEETPFGECAKWQKTYDLGKKGSYEKTRVTFTKEEIFGLNPEEPSYEKSTDFAPTVATLSVFSDLKSDLEKNGKDFKEDLAIFAGDPYRCEKSFFEGNLFDCCQKMDGMAVLVKLARCKTEEKCLAEHRHNGKCRFVGSQKLKMGTITEHVYCCFPTKLARIVQEEGRKQLKIKWGSAEHPKCRGFTLEELQKIDFNKIDLSEFVEEIQADPKAQEGQLRSNIQRLQSKLQSEVEQRQMEPKPQAPAGQEKPDAPN